MLAYTTNSFVRLLDYFTLLTFRYSRVSTFVIFKFERLATIWSMLKVSGFADYFESRAIATACRYPADDSRDCFYIRAASERNQCVTESNRVPEEEQVRDERN